MGSQRDGHDLATQHVLRLVLPANAVVILIEEVRTWKPREVDERAPDTPSKRRSQDLRGPGSLAQSPLHQTEWGTAP